MKGYIAIRNGTYEEFQEGCRVKRKSSEWALGTIREAYEKVVKEESWTFGFCARNLEKKYGLPEADHCASRWKGRSHPVV